MIETLGVDLWIGSRLAADTAIQSVVGTTNPRIYPDVAPAGVDPPYILYTMQSGLDENLLGGVRGAADMVFSVRAVVQSQSYRPAAALANRIDAVLHGARGTAPEFPCEIHCTRLEPVRYPETGSGVSNRHLGGLYRIFAVS